MEAWLRAAGALRYVLDNFTNAPSVDLAADTLLVLAALMTVRIYLISIYFLIIALKTVKKNIVMNVDTHS